MNKLFDEKGGKFEISAQGHDLAPFVGNVTKVKILSEIKPPLIMNLGIELCKKGKKNLIFELKFGWLLILFSVPFPNLSTYKKIFFKK